MLWDLINIAWLLDAGWFTMHSVPTPALDAEVRWVPHGPGRHQMVEAIDVDRDEIFADFYRCLEEHANRTRDEATLADGAIEDPGISSVGTET